MQTWEKVLKRGYNTAFVSISQKLYISLYKFIFIVKIYLDADNNDTMK